MLNVHIITMTPMMLIISAQSCFSMCAPSQNHSSLFDLVHNRYVYCTSNESQVTYSPSKFVVFPLCWSSRKAHTEQLSGQGALQQPDNHGLGTHEKPRKLEATYQDKLCLSLRRCDSNTRLVTTGREDKGVKGLVWEGFCAYGYLSFQDLKFLSDCLLL